MARILFQNGPEAPEIALDEEGDPDAPAKKLLSELENKYGTVDGAAAWFEGSAKPKHLEVDEDDAFVAVPDASRLKERVVTAPDAPEVEAKHAERDAREAERRQAENEEAVKANIAAHEEAAKKADDAKAEDAKAKTTKK